MNTAEIIYTGSLKTQCTHPQSGTMLITDAPTDNFGNGSAFSPTDLVCVALATCIITTIGIRLRNENIQLDGSTLSVKKHMTTTLPRKIEKIEIHMQIKGSYDAKLQERIRFIVHDCPVAQSLHPEISQEVNIQFE